MAASISRKDASCAVGSPDYFSGSGFLPGHTIVFYVGGQFAGVAPSGPCTGITETWGSLSQDIFMPTEATGAHPVAAVDNTTGDVATTTVTLT